MSIRKSTMEEVRKTGATSSVDIAIIGGGHGARRAAEGVRDVAPNASIAIISDEVHPPYERPPLSKAILMNPEEQGVCFSRSFETYAPDGIELLLGCRAESVDMAAKVITTDQGRDIRFQRVIFATGSRNRVLPSLSPTVGSVHYLRSLSDAHRIALRLKDTERVAVVGGGFIGLEVASAARAHGAGVTVYEAGHRLAERALPAEASAVVEAVHRANGVDIRFGSVVEGAEHTSAGVELRTATGTVCQDLVLVGIGVLPNDEIARAAGLPTDDGILVDATGASSVADAFAAGEVARVRSAQEDRGVRAETWQMADQQAYAVGRTAAGSPTSFTELPWGWSDQFDQNIQFAGHFPQDARIVHRRGEGSQALFYLTPESTLSGVIAFNSPRDIGGARRAIKLGRTVLASAFDGPRVDWQGLLRSA